jgi:pyrroline-5-carboxylate reductase
MKRRIGIVGFGSMGKMLFDKLIGSGLVGEDDMFLANRTFTKIENLRRDYTLVHLCRNNSSVFKVCDIAFVCVEFGNMAKVLEEARTAASASSLPPKCHLVSLNASLTLEQIEAQCPGFRVSRLIPSVTAEVNQSVSLVCHNERVTPEDKEALRALLAGLGEPV